MRVLKKDMYTACRAGLIYYLFLLMLIILLFAGVAFSSEMVVGLIPEQNVFRQLERYEPLGSYIEEKTGIRIRFTILPRYGNIIDHFASGRMDAAFWGSFTGAMAKKKLNVEYIARPLWLDGTSTYHGYILVRKDSGIKSVSDMKGKTIAFVEKATTAGYVFPMAYFREHGVDHMESFFKEYFFTGSHDAAIKAVFEGEADIGCAKNTMYEMMVEKNPKIGEELLKIARSPDVPSNGLGVRNDLDPSIKRKLMEVLLGMDRDPYGRKVLKQFGAKGFIPASEEDYNGVFSIAERAGIDLKTYSYVNK